MELLTCAASYTLLPALAQRCGLHVLQDVDAQLQEFDTKQNIDIGLIIGGKHGAANEPIEDQMDMRQRAGDMHMGHSRSLSAGEPAPGAAVAEKARLG